VATPSESSTPDGARRAARVLNLSRQDIGQLTDFVPQVFPAAALAGQLARGRCVRVAA